MIKKEKSLFNMLIEIFFATIVIIIIMALIISLFDMISLGLGKLSFGFLAILYIFFFRRELLSSEVGEKTTEPLKRKEIFVAIIYFTLVPFFISFLVSNLDSAIIIREEYLKRVQLNHIFLIIFPVILAPIYEEFFFRGYVYKKLRRKMNWKLALIISSIFFGVIHIDIYQMIYGSVIGIMLGFLYEKSQSLRLPIIAHMVNNLLSVLGRIFPNITITRLGTLLFIGMGSIIFYLIISYINKNHHKNIKWLQENKISVFWKN